MSDTVQVTILICLLYVLRFVLHFFLFVLYCYHVMMNKVIYNVFRVLQIGNVCKF